MSVLYAAKRKLRQNPLTWRYGFNLRPSLSYLFGSDSLSTEARRIVSDLNQHGIAVTTSDALMGDAAVYQELGRAVEHLQQEHASAIQAARAQAGDRNAIGDKTFIYFLLGTKPLIDSGSVFARFALQPQILGVANAYMGMYSQLRYYNVWHTLANTGPARESQLWHRDRDDYLTCKVFLYLNDVDDGAGPFTYARGTHPKGANHAEPPFTLEGTVKRSDDRQMATVAPPESWLRATGRRGTIIFADTRGYHKGGEARTHDRIMYTCMFVSPASQVREMMDVVGRVKAPADRAAAFALSRYA
jgi:hypothetical protein